jgi:hypothetical protein
VFFAVMANGVDGGAYRKEMRIEVVTGGGRETTALARCCG